MPDDKFISPEPPPTPYEAEVLTILIEEMAEAIQRATKMKRFGVHEVQPGQKLSNRDRLSDEVGDVVCLLNVAARAGLTDPRRIMAAAQRKRKALKRFMQTTGDGDGDTPKNCERDTRRPVRRRDRPGAGGQIPR